jgi:hypothetical protein
MPEVGLFATLKFVIARSEATKQSILSFCGSMDCFAPLAMTICMGCLKLNRTSNASVIAMTAATISNDGD